MAKVTIDDIEYEVPDGKNMLEVCLSLGMDLTYFCWHPAMHSVGACRQCAVINYRDAEDTRGRITMACMLDARDGTRISLKDQKGVDFRAANIESLMLNHPHDCPVCDEGGECHLQDMTIMSGHNYRRYRFPKRTHLNQDLGPFLYHEMNRCIQCYRCVRFYNDYAGGTDFGVYASAGRVYFGRSEPGTLENEFSGNLVEVCPTGVFTDKTLRKHYTRKWDLTSAPSICQQCSVGCNILASERYGTMRRVMTRYNSDVNGYFLCDRGRFGYEYVNSEARLTRAAQKDNSLGEDALTSVKALAASKPKMIGIGSPRASLESNFMLRQLVGKENFYHGIPSQTYKAVNTVLDVLRNGKVRSVSTGEISSFDTVFVLGEDVTNTVPMVALQLRQAVLTKPKQRAFKMGIQKWNDAAIREVVQHDKGPFFIATPKATRLDDIATSLYHGDTRSLVAVAKKVADEFKKDKQSDDFAGQVAKAFKGAKKALIVSGTGMMSPEIIQSAGALAQVLKDAGLDAGIVFAVPEANSMGLAMIEAAGSLDDAVKRATSESGQTAVVLETDLFYRTNEKAAKAFLDAADKTILLNHTENRTTPEADYILPAGTFAESSGTSVNNEGRAQRYYQVYPPKEDMKSAWAWLDMMINQTDEARPFDAIIEEMVAEIPFLNKVYSLAPHADYRQGGGQKIPRETHRFSGRTAMAANINVHEEKPPVDKDSPLSYTMEGYHGLNKPTADITHYWAPKWNSIQSINKFQIEVGGELKGGNPGKRLIEPNENGSISFPELPAGGGKEFEVLPDWNIWGSGEMSSQSPAVAQRVPQPTISISKKSLEKAGHTGKEKLKIRFDSVDLVLPVRVDDSLADGVVMISKGFKGTEGAEFPYVSGVEGV